MAILRKMTNRDFTVVSNRILRDQELSLTDRGLLITLLSFPDDWEFSVRGLVQILPDGKSCVRASVLRLEEKGYIIRRGQVRNKKGQLDYGVWEIYDEPQKPFSDFQTSDNQTSENQMSENRPQLNTKELNTNKSNTNSSSGDEDDQKISIAHAESVCGDINIVRDLFSAYQQLEEEQKQLVTQTIFERCCQEVSEYGKPVRNKKNYYTACLINKLNEKPSRQTQKGNWFTQYEMRQDYDFEMLEREFSSVT